MTRNRLDELYRRFAPVIHRRCLSMLGDPEEARDATHDVYEILHRKLDTFRGDSEILTWIYRIATNHCLNLIRSRNVRRRAMAQMTVAGEEPRPAGPGEAVTLERQDLLRSLLSRFDERKVQILVHFYHDEMTQEEIAKLMGVSERAVRKSIKKTLDRIRADHTAMEALTSERRLYSEPGPCPGAETTPSRKAFDEGADGKRSME